MTAPTPPRQFQSFTEITAFIWSVADLLRGDYKQSEYGKVILPLTVLRRLDCVLDAPGRRCSQKHEQLKGGQVENLEPVLNRIAGEQFYNTSKLDFEKLLDDPNHLADNLTAYIRGLLRRTRGTSSRSSTSTSRSPSSTRRTCSTWSSRSSPRSTSTPRSCRTSRWATSSRS